MRMFRLIVVSMWRRMLLPWAVVAFGVLGALLFCVLISVTRQVDGISVLVSTLGFVMVIVNPVLAAIPWSDARQHRVHELWVTAPVAPFRVVVTYWLAGLSIVVAQIAALAGVIIAVVSTGSPDWGKLTTAVFGLAVLGTFFSAIGVWAGIQTRRAVSAGILGIATALGFWLLGPFSAITPGSWAEWVRSWALVHHTFGFEQGIVIAGDLIYFLIGIAVFIMLATRKLAALRLGRPWHYGMISAMAIVGILAAFNVLAQRIPTRWDLSHDRQLTVQPETIAAVKGVSQPVSIRAYFQPGTEEAFKIDQVLRQLKGAVPTISVALVDMDRYPRSAIEDQVASVGTVVIQLGKSRRLLGYQDVFTPAEDGHDRLIIEGAIVAALRSMTAHRNQGVYYVVGHGQAPIDSFSGKSLSRWLRILELDGWPVRPVQMAQFGRVPTDSVVVVTAPRYSMSSSDIDQLDRFIRRGGRVLVAADYGGGKALSRLLAGWGVRLGTGYISDPELSMFRTPSILMPALTRNPIAAPIISQELSVVMPVSVSLAIDGAAAKVPLAQTGAKAIDLDANRGPFVVAAAIGVGDGGALVFGDVDWMTNDMIDVAGNRIMALQAIRFLAGDMIPYPDAGHGHAVPLTDGQWLWVLWISIGVPVGLGLGLGMLQWKRR